jgi:hypothetical protein
MKSTVENPFQTGLFPSMDRSSEEKKLHPLRTNRFSRSPTPNKSSFPKHGCMPDDKSEYGTGGDSGEISLCRAPFEITLRLSSREPIILGSLKGQ